MVGPGAGDIDPQRGTPEHDIALVEGLLTVLHDGVARIRDINDTFEEIAGVQRELTEGAADVDQAAAFFESIDPDKPPKSFHTRLKERIGNQDISLIASIGYASVLQAGRDKLIAREAEAWAESPEAEAYVGLEVCISPSGTWSREDSRASMERDNLAIGFQGSHWISGRITKVSPEKSGTIFLADGRATYRADLSATPTGELTVKDYSKGQVSRIFVSQNFDLLPSAEVAVAPTET